MGPPPLKTQTSPAAKVEIKEPIPTENNEVIRNSIQLLNSSDNFNARLNYFVSGNP